MKLKLYRLLLSGLALTPVLLGTCENSILMRIPQTDYSLDQRVVNTPTPIAFSGFGNDTYINEQLQVSKKIFENRLALIKKTFSELSNHVAYALGKISQLFEYLKHITNVHTTQESEPLKEVLRGSSKNTILSAYKKQVQQMQDDWRSQSIGNKPKNALRIATYNVHFWANPEANDSNIDAVFDVIKKINADVICLQEVSWGKTYFNNYSPQEIVKKMRSMGYVYGGNETFANTGEKVLNAPFGNMIFSKYKLTDVARVTYKDRTRSFVGGTIEYEGKPLRIYCTHLDVFDNTGLWRKQEMNELVNYVAENDNNGLDVFVAGDFNEPRQQDYSPELWKEFKAFNEQVREEAVDDNVSQILHKAGFKDSMETTGKKHPLTCWTGSTVDFGYLKEEGLFTFSNSQVFPDSASDHLPVVFDLKLRSE